MISGGFIIYINTRNKMFTFLKYDIILFLLKHLSLMGRAMNEEAVPWSGSFVLVTCTVCGIMTSSKIQSSLSLI